MNAPTNAELLKPDESFEQQIQEAIAETKRAEAKGNSDWSELCLEREISLDESASTHNAFYFYSDFAQGRINYASCLKAHDLVQAGREDVMLSCCDPATSQSCPALKMRAREVEAGRALFFIDRRSLVKDNEDRLARLQSSNNFRYGKARTSVESLKTHAPSPESVQAFNSTLKEHNPSHIGKPALVKKDEFNPNVAGRNLLGEAIEKIMETSK